MCPLGEHPWGTLLLKSCWFPPAAPPAKQMSTSSSFKAWDGRSQLLHGILLSGLLGITHIQPIRPQFPLHQRAVKPNLGSKVPFAWICPSGDRTAHGGAGGPHVLAADSFISESSRAPPIRTPRTKPSRQPRAARCRGSSSDNK